MMLERMSSSMIAFGPESIKMREHIYSFLDLARAGAILDIGCGYGYDLFRIGKMAKPDARLFGIDKSEKAIKEAKNKPDGGA